jgi:hypothetical protein
MGLGWAQGFYVPGTISSRAWAIFPERREQLRKCTFLTRRHHPFRCGVSRTGQNTAQPFHNKYQRAFDGQIHKRGVTAIVCIPMSGSSPAHPCRSVRDVKGLRLASTRKPRIFSVTGGEDCALRMIVLNNDRALYVSKSFEGHTEAVRSIATHPRDWCTWLVHLMMVT